MSEPIDELQRFSARAAAYARGRPSYPAALGALLLETGYRRPGDVIADVGSGTGKLSRLFLDLGHRVLGVEPNAEMREAGERELGAHPGFTSADGRAEATGLPERSVDLVAAGQAFHWFEARAARVEFLRILRDSAPVVLVWNDRRDGASPFMAAYENLLATHGTDYRRVARRRLDAGALETLYGAAGIERRVLEHRQALDREGLLDRLRSCSYLPGEGDPRQASMLAAAARLFDAHQRDGRVQLEYDTRLYLGRLRPASGSR
jgi:SAM-dependent methyltransferase